MSTSDNCISSSSGGKLAGEGGGGDADRAAVAAVIDVPDGHEVITEGQITMLYPKIENSVFYNPVQVQNRDLSVLMLGMYAERRTERMWTTRKRKEVRKKMMREEEENRAGAAAAADGNNGGGDARKETKEERKASLARLEVDLDARVAKERSSIDFAKMTRESSQTVDGMSIFEALAASGLRSLRYWKEVPGVRTIVVNDLDPVAVDMARENVVRNGLADDLVGAGREEDEGGGASRTRTDVVTARVRGAYDCRSATPRTRCTWLDSPHGYRRICAIPPNSSTRRRSTTSSTSIRTGAPRRSSTPRCSRYPTAASSP